MKIAYKIYAGLWVVLILLVGVVLGATFVQQ